MRSPRPPRGGHCLGRRQRKEINKKTCDGVGAAGGCRRARSTESENMGVSPGSLLRPGARQAQARHPAPPSCSPILAVPRILEAFPWPTLPVLSPTLHPTQAPSSPTFPGTLPAPNTLRTGRPRPTSLAAPHLKPPAPRWAPRCGNCPWRRRDGEPSGTAETWIAAGSPHPVPSRTAATSRAQPIPPPPAAAQPRPSAAASPAGSVAAEGGAGTS